MAPTDQLPRNTLLDRVATAIHNRHEPGGLVFKFLTWMRRLAAVMTWGYAILLGAILAGMEWQAERHWLLSFCLFLPAHGWLLPLLGLTPFCLLFRPKLVWAHAACMVLVLYVYMDLEWSMRGTPKGKTVTLITNNIGENNRQPLTPFVQAEQPDVIALQDAYGRGSAYAREYTNRFVRELGQFVVISKWPIRDAGVVPNPTGTKVPMAAWFELDCDGRALVVYDVHLPTPRSQLESLRGLGLLAALVGREGRHGSKLRQVNQHFWDDQMELARGMVEVIKKDKRPALIAGDFNVPNHGYIYHLFNSAFADAFEKRGMGYGLSFPGYSRNPLTWFGPWLRLDKIYANDGLRPLYCRVEPSRKSQHRAVVATVEFVDGN